MNVVIRRVDNTDPAVQLALRDMDRECLPTDFPVDTSDGVWWVAWKKNIPIAYASLKQSNQGADIAYYSRAGVIPAFRGRGIQKKMLRVLLKYAKAEGWARVISDTSKDNVASSNSLITCGFKLYRPATPWSFDSALYWYKALT